MQKKTLYLVAIQIFGIDIPLQMANLKIKKITRNIPVEFKRNRNRSRICHSRAGIRHNYVMVNHFKNPAELIHSDWCQPGTATNREDPKFSGKKCYI